MAQGHSPIASRSRTIFQRLRSFRYLIAAGALAIVVAMWEVSHRDDPVDLMLSSNPNFTSTVCELYPGRTEPLYMKAIQAGLCAQLRTPIPDVCRQFNPRTIKNEVNDIFQQGLKTGVKHIEGIYYDYVQFLVISGGTKSEINRAYEAWRTNFPLSKLPDPRQVSP